MAMADERLRLFARLAARRAELLSQLLGLDRRALTEEPFLDGWTVKDLLAHIGAWDRWEHRQMARMVVGENPEDVAIDAQNAMVVAEWRDRSLDQVVSELQDARTSWATWLRGLSDGEFFQSRPFDDWDWAFRNCLEIQWQHDAEHAAQVAAWRKAYGPGGESGPRCVLLAALDAARQEVLTLSALAPSDSRASRPVCGVWTLREVLGHLADWDAVGVEGLRVMARGRQPDLEIISDIDAWNAEHAQARRDQPWEDVWADLQGTRAALRDILEGMDQAKLGRWYRYPWGARGTAYQFVAVFISHDREHAEDLREALTGEA